MEISARQKRFRKIAKDRGVAGSREVLKLFFQNAQRRFSRTPSEVRPAFEVVALEGDLQRATGDCLFYALGDGWLRQLAEPIAEQMIVDDAQRAGFLSDLLGEDAPKVRENMTPSRGRVAAINQACIIEHEDDGILGTGMLVGPDLVLTAHHVFDKYWGREGQGPKLRARFLPAPFEPPAEPRTQGLEAPFAEDWQFDGLGADASERSSAGWLDPAILRANLDYALVRIASTVGFARGTTQTCDQAGRNCVVWLYHAPAGAEIRSSRGVVIMRHESRSPLRLEYQLADGENRPGSSGGACLDQEGRLVGHHQAGLGQNLNGSVCRGVPWSAVKSAIRRNGRKLPAERPPYLWWVRTPDLMDAQHGFRQQIAGGPYYRPLVGRHAFQNAILSSLGAKPRWCVFFVSGPPGSGTSLTLRVLETLLHERDHIIAAIDVGSAIIQGRRYMDQFFATVREKAQSTKIVEPATMEVPEPPSYAAVRSYVRARVEEMERLREGRMIWLCVDGLLAQPPANEFDRLSLEALYEVTRRYDWLRTVILAPRPEALTDAEAFFDTVPPPTADELTYYVSRRLKAAGQPITEAEARQLAQEIATEASNVVGRPELTSVEAGLAIDTVLAQLYPAGTATDHIVKIQDPCW